MTNIIQIKCKHEHKVLADIDVDSIKSISPVTEDGVNYCDIVMKNGIPWRLIGTELEINDQINAAKQMFSKHKN